MLMFLQADRNGLHLTLLPISTGRPKYSYFPRMEIRKQKAQKSIVDMADKITRDGKQFVAELSFGLFH
ncbi:unnamed protein product [Caenorhabditis nigoni]